jgi:AcrR family transcriptional regulator
MAAARRPYHHGNLRRTLLDAAVEVIEEVGPAQMSLREVSRRAGVSNAAPTHHFGDKPGLLTALATEGYRLLAAALAQARQHLDDFVEVGVAYVNFALSHRAHFEVMFRPELYHRDDRELLASQRAAAEHLYEPAAAQLGESTSHRRDPGIAAWSLAHGLATLILNGNLEPDTAKDAERLARRIGRLLVDHPLQR